MGPIIRLWVLPILPLQYLLYTPNSPTSILPSHQTQKTTKINYKSTTNPSPHQQTPIHITFHITNNCHISKNPSQTPNSEPKTTCSFLLLVFIYFLQQFTINKTFLPLFAGQTVKKKRNNMSSPTQPKRCVNLTFFLALIVCVALCFLTTPAFAADEEVIPVAINVTASRLEYCLKDATGVDSLIFPNVVLVDSNPLPDPPTPFASSPIASINITILPPPDDLAPGMILMTPGLMIKMTTVGTTVVLEPQQPEGAAPMMGPSLQDWQNALRTSRWSPYNPFATQGITYREFEVVISTNGTDTLTTTRVIVDYLNKDYLLPKVLRNLSWNVPPILADKAIWNITLSPIKFWSYSDRIETVELSLEEGKEVAKSTYDLDTGVFQLKDILLPNTPTVFLFHTTSVCDGSTDMELTLTAKAEPVLIENVTDGPEDAVCLLKNDQVIQIFPNFTIAVDEIIDNDPNFYGLSIEVSVATQLGDVVAWVDGYTSEDLELTVVLPTITISPLSASTPLKKAVYEEAVRALRYQTTGDLLNADIAVSKEFAITAKNSGATQNGNILRTTFDFITPGRFPTIKTTQIPTILVKPSQNEQQNFTQVVDLTKIMNFIENIGDIFIVSAVDNTTTTDVTFDVDTSTLALHVALEKDETKSYKLIVTDACGEQAESSLVVSFALGAEGNSAFGVNTIFPTIVVVVAVALLNVLF